MSVVRGGGERNTTEPTESLKRDTISCVLSFHSSGVIGSSRPMGIRGSYVLEMITTSGWSLVIASTACAFRPSHAATSFGEGFFTRMSVKVQPDEARLVTDQPSADPNTCRAVDTQDMAIESPTTTARRVALGSPHVH